MTDLSAPPTPAEYPSYLKDSDELPQPVRDIPLWSENYLTQAFDPSTGVGFFFHLSRMPFNYNVWEGVFTCYLPGDRFLVARDFSWDSNDKGPGSNALRFEVVKPWERWSKRFRGAALLVTGDQLRAGPIADDSHVFVDADLTFDNIGPVFDIGDMGDQFWARAHYEQHGKFSGRVSFDATHLALGSESYEFNGTGLRDHSVGARDILKMNNHVWTHGEFPSGRLFMVMDVHTKVGPPFLYVVVGDKDGFHTVELTRPTARIDDPSQVFDSHELCFVGPDGPSVIKAEILQAIPYSFTGPNEWSLGTHPNAHHLVIEGLTRFEWDGEVGYGLTERSVCF
ncbi:hypothetical protein [Mycobacterium avium]|uniref:hypothetical protein n=1 Tax=Mycobacterium avium TaxID=1764 RepID=UPI0009FF0B7B|nr:hypothetical protein [Mycobacterium avium]